MDEFFQEGDDERRLGLDVGAMNDRATAVLPKTQVRVVSPRHFEPIGSFARLASSSSSHCRCGRCGGTLWRPMMGTSRPWPTPTTICLLCTMHEILSFIYCCRQQWQRKLDALAEPPTPTASEAPQLPTAAPNTNRRASYQGMSQSWHVPPLVMRVQQCARRPCPSR